MSNSIVFITAVCVLLKIKENSFFKSHYFRVLRHVKESAYGDAQCGSDQDKSVIPLKTINSYYDTINHIPFSQRKSI